MGKQWQQQQQWSDNKSSEANMMNFQKKNKMR
jgi:hypothetical protein